MPSTGHEITFSSTDFHREKNFNTFNGHTFVAAVVVEMKHYFNLFTRVLIVKSRGFALGEKMFPLKVTVEGRWMKMLKVKSLKCKVTQTIWSKVDTLYLFFTRDQGKHQSVQFV